MSLIFRSAYTTFAAVARDPASASVAPIARTEDRVGTKVTLVQSIFTSRRSLFSTVRRANNARAVRALARNLWGAGES